MGHVSDQKFHTFHALRINGFANVETLSEMTTADVGDVEAHLAELGDAGLALFRENRSLWQLTPDGRAAHAEHLAADLAGLDVAAIIGPHYEPFLTINSDFKTLCGDWQLRNGEPNDHSDPDYDAAVVDRLHELHEQAHPLVEAMGAELVRMQSYAPRLVDVLGRVRAGETKLFTGVMCGSYHDVWMELHEDLILTQGINRAAEGSF